VSADPDETTPTLTLGGDCGEAGKWTLANIESENYIAALAASGGNFEIRTWR